MENKIIKKLSSYFNIGFNRDASQNKDKAYILRDVIKKEVDIKGGEKNIVVGKVKDAFPSNVQKLFDFWQNDFHYTQQSWKSRQQLFQDCDLMFLNSAIMARAAEACADEVVQADSGVQIITVQAKRKVKQAILEFYDKINIYDYIRATALSIIKYGNAGWVLSYDDSGIDEIIPRNIYAVKERLEFSPYEVQEMMKNKNKFLYDYKSKVVRINQLIDMISDKDNISSYYKDYLFGFVVDDYTLPPWRFLHFRNHNNESPFKPFGVPIFIHSIAPYMQFDAAMTMQIAARGAAFPKEVYQINLPAAMPPTEKLNTAIEFARELQNSGINAVAKERDGVGEKIITIKDLFEYELQNPNIDLGRIGDIEALRDDLIISTMLPRNLLDPHEGGFGDSGISLIQKSKPFARLIYRIQNIILQGVNQLTKIHLIHSGKFPLDEIDFITSMPYPDSQASEELIRSQNDLLSLANSVIDALSQKFMDGQPIPASIMKDIYTKFLPYEDNVVDEWVRSIEKEKNKSQEEPSEEEPEVMRDDSKQKIEEKWQAIERNTGKEKLREKIEDVVFESKQTLLREGSLQGKHYYSSKNQYLDFPAELLREFDINEANKEEGLKPPKPKPNKEEMMYLNRHKKELIR